jgi:hypothetical protein
MPGMLLENGHVLLAKYLVYWSENLFCYIHGPLPRIHILGRWKAQVRYRLSDKAIDPSFKEIKGPSALAIKVSLTETSEESIVSLHNFPCFS